MNTEDAARILGSADTVSNKIRALDVAGYPRAEIARLLNKRYQHVRNVLEADRLKAAPSPRGFGESAPPRFEGEHAAQDGRLMLRADGSLMLPRAVVEAWGLAPGDVLMGRLQGEAFELVTARVSAARARDMVRALVSPGPSLSEELLADRRRAFEAEIADD